ncbi:hypothetical protein TNCV_1160861 [Trichonephila clavipes]|nr:hypothetical protein TNCV_1160861 [Trichonephila clavipes]
MTHPHLLSQIMDRPSRPSQYGGYDPGFVTEWIRVRITSKAWMYFLREKRSDWIPVSNGKQRTPSVIGWDHHL